MRARLDPFSFLVISIAGWINQRQQQIIEYLVEENRVLREQIGNRRMRFSDNQRCRLAAKRKETWRENPGTSRDHRDTGDIVGLASEADCTEVRWERKPKSRPPKDTNRDF
jgi:hypothetical protein